MDCKETEKNVMPYIRGELKGKEQREFLAHIKSCKNCYEELEVYYTIFLALQQLDKDPNVNYNIKSMLEENLKAAEKKTKHRKMKWIFAFAVLGMLILCITVYGFI